MSLLLRWDDTYIGNLFLPEGGLYRNHIILVSGTGACHVLEHLYHCATQNQHRVFLMTTAIDWNVSMTVLEYLDFFLCMCGCKATSDEKERVMQVCTILPYKSTRMDASLVKRVLLSCVLLAGHADLYLMEDPFTGMDVITKNSILSLFQEMKDNVCIVLSQPVSCSSLQYVDEQWLISHDMVMFERGWYTIPLEDTVIAKRTPRMVMYPLVIREIKNRWKISHLCKAYIVPWLLCYLICEDWLKIGYLCTTLDKLIFAHSCILVVCTLLPLMRYYDIERGLQQIRTESTLGLYRGCQGRLLYTLVDAIDTGILSTLLVTSLFPRGVWSISWMTVETILLVSYILMMCPPLVGMVYNVASIYGGYAYHDRRYRNPFYWLSLINYGSMLFADAIHQR